MTHKKQYQELERSTKWQLVHVRWIKPETQKVINRTNAFLTTHSWILQENKYHAVLEYPAKMYYGIQAEAVLCARLRLMSIMHAIERDIFGTNAPEQNGHVTEAKHSNLDKTVAIVRRNDPAHLKLSDV
ncbi:hypothetical protein CLF_111782 [Clonorchis sinensis]|uniref:Uncharacterized protein n=1 Tax=Clonorchis sinensis TaxID=79923 RepID=G7YLZ4_CLOSI|nr:hypothetical protein CLF_111782 [Clonorchis sinensis]